MISVCIATFNGGAYIKEQLLSILHQIDINDEIIVSDDSSTDNTLDIIKSLNDERIKLFANNKFHSPIYNFENAILHAKGDYIFLCDQDDVWLPNKTKLIKEYLREYNLVVSNCKIVDSNLNVIEDSFFKVYNSQEGFWRNLYKNSYIGCCMAFRRKLLKKVLPFPKGLPMHDIWIGLLAELNGEVFFIEEPLLLYRRHGNNVSFSVGESRNTLLFRLKYRILLLCKIIKRQYLKL